MVGGGGRVGFWMAGSDPGSAEGRTKCGAETTTGAGVAIRKIEDDNGENCDDDDGAPEPSSTHKLKKNSQTSNFFYGVGLRVPGGVCHASMLN